MVVQCDVLLVDEDCDDSGGVANGSDFGHKVSVILASIGEVIAAFVVEVTEGTGNGSVPTATESCPSG